MRKPCCDKQDTNKGAWSKQEDEKLVDYIAKHGEGCWRTLPQAAGLLRCGKSCRLRWINYLRPDLKRGNFADDEQDLIIKLHALLGNRWSLIAGRLPGRTDNEVKNYWNSHLRRKLINMGIDPSNHRLMAQTTSISRPQQNQQDHSDSDATSSGSKHIVDHPINGPLMIVAANNINNDLVSDAGSCLDDHHHDHGELPDLNLDLSITIPSSVSPINYSDKKDRKPDTSSIDDHIDQHAPSPPLLLFR